MPSRSQFLSLLLAAAVGIALGLAEVYVLGFLAAVPYPHWYVSLLRDFEPLRYALWSALAITAPVALLAAACGVTLARLGNSHTIAVPFVAVGAWLFSRLFVVQIVYGEPVPSFGFAFVSFPVSLLTRRILPPLAFLFAYNLMARTAPHVA